jgi:hypothetical protein
VPVQSTECSVHDKVASLPLTAFRIFRLPHTSEDEPRRNASTNAVTTSATLGGPVDRRPQPRGPQPRNPRPRLPSLDVPSLVIPSLVVPNLIVTNLVVTNLVVTNLIAVWSAEPRYSGRGCAVRGVTRRCERADRPAARRRATGNAFSGASELPPPMRTSLRARQDPGVRGRWRRAHAAIEQHDRLPCAPAHPCWLPSTLPCASGRERSRSSLLDARPATGVEAVTRLRGNR